MQLTLRADIHWDKGRILKVTESCCTLHNSELPKHFDLGLSHKLELAPPLRWSNIALDR
jgi:hypothetical protein